MAAQECSLEFNRLPPNLLPSEPFFVTRVVEFILLLPFNSLDFFDILESRDSMVPLFSLASYLLSWREASESLALLI